MLEHLYFKKELNCPSFLKNVRNQPALTGLFFTVLTKVRQRNLSLKSWRFRHRKREMKQNIWRLNHHSLPFLSPMILSSCHVPCPIFSLDTLWRKPRNWTHAIVTRWYSPLRVDVFRAGHFRYFFIFSIIKKDFFALFVKLITVFCTSPI